MATPGSTRCTRCRRAPTSLPVLLLGLCLAVCTARTHAQKLFPPSTFMCHGDDKAHRVCLFSNLVFCKGQLYYLSDTKPTLPELSGYRGTEPGPDIRVVAPRNLPCSAGGAPATSIEVVPRSTLIYRMHSDNWFHTIIDIQPHVHQLLCKFFNLCTHTPTELAAVKLLFYDKFPKHTAAFAETWQCYSSHPPVYLGHPEAADKPLLLKATLAGWTAAIFDGPNIAGSRHMGGLQAETWFQRVRTCTNTPITNHVVAMPRPVVTFIHRSFFDSRKARAFLNVHDTVDELRERFPHVDFRIVRLRAMTFQQIVRTFHDASVIFAVSGAAVSNVIWMRRGAIMIDIGFANYHPRWVESITHTVHPILGVFSQMMTLGDPLTTPTRWERVAKDPVFQSLSKQEMLDVILNHRCPRTSPQAAYQCAALWTYFRSDVALPIEGMTHAVKTALERLRDNGMTWALGDKPAPASVIAAAAATNPPKRALLAATSLRGGAAANSSTQLR